MSAASPNQRSTCSAHWRPSLIAQTIERLAAAGVAGGEDAVHRRRVGRRLPRCRAHRARRRAARAASCSGWRNPIASRTSSAGRDSSVPGSGANGGAPSFCAQWICSTAPFEPERCVVEIAKSRSPPSFSAYEVRSFIGHCGHGVRSSGPLHGRLAEHLDLGHRRRVLAVGVGDAVGARVAAADHDHVLAGRGDRPLGGGGASSPAVPTSAAIDAGAVVEVVHREVDAVELAARDRQVARHARAGRDDDRVVGRREARRR